VLLDKKITIIGPGQMAEAMISGLLREKAARPENLLASGPTQSRLDTLTEKYHIQVSDDNAASVVDADVVVLAIKPQTLDRVMAQLQGKIPTNALVLSIIAGAPMAKIINGLSHLAVVRSMPNTPARIGRGITVWTASSAVSDVQKSAASTILGALGDEIFMDEEKYLDMATALSGTGPAYIFMFMEAMVDAGVHLGFPRRVAEELVTQTMLGSVHYYQNSSEDGRPMHLARMRNQVTSPGGTTASALYFLEKAGFRTAISRAIWAAYERSLELGKDAKTHAPQE
jgi:pyrroline-5-carboxylate reductase